MSQSHIAHVKRAQRIALLTIAISVFATLGARAFDPLFYDVQLIRRLADVGMKNYALLHIERMLKKYPDRKDHIYYAKARFHYKLNERRQGEEAISRIPVSSAFYTESQLIVAEEALRKGKLESAEKAYAEYFRKVQKPASQDAAAVEAFSKAATYYAQVQIEKGDGAKAAEILGYLRNIKGPGAPDQDQLILTVAQAAYSATDVRIDRNQPIDKDLIQKQIKQLLDIQWRHAGYDPITVEAFIQVARGQIYLEKYQEALQTLQTVSENAALVAKNVPRSRSPLPSAFFYYARIFDETGRQLLAKGDNMGAQDKFMIAAKFYNDKLMKAFPQSPLANKALLFYGKMSETAKEQLGINLPTPSGAGSSKFPVMVKEGDRYYDVDQYDKAADAYLAAIKTGRLNSQIPAIGTRLVFCLGQEKRLLEAAAIASYLGDVFPNAEQTPLALLQVGQLLFQRAQGLPEGEDKDNQQADAMQIWAQFVRTAPQHPKAPDIAFFLAEMKYAEAEKLAAKSRDLKDVREKERIKEEARKKFLETIPKYETMLKLFPATPQAVRALYKLGWVYYNAGENQKAADYFLNYVKRETNPARGKDRLLAKFYAAEQLMFSDSPRDAVPHFLELISWFEDDSSEPDTNIEGAERIKENAANYIGWSYDLAAEQFRPEINRINEEIGVQEDKIALADDAAEQARALKAQAQKDLAIAKDELKEKIEAVNTPLPEPEARALKESMPPEEELAALNEDEKSQMIAFAKEKSKEIAVRFRQQDIDGFVGENAAIESRKRDLATALRTLETRLEKQKSLLEQQQAELKKTQEEQQRLKQYLKDLVEPVQENGQEVAKLKKELEDIKEKFKKAVTAARKHPDEAIRKKAAEYARKLQESGKQVSAQLEEAEKRLARQMPPDFKKQVEDIKQRLSEANDSYAKRNKTIQNLTDKTAVLEQEVAKAQNTLDANNAMIALNQARIEILRRDVDKRDAAVEELGLEEKQQAAMTAWNTAFEASKARAELLQKQAQDAIAAAEAEKSEANKKIAELKEERKPVKADILERKDIAMKAFLDFLENYPESRYVPSQMARVGTIYLEKEDYQNAVKYLDKLAERFPDAEVTTNAIFDLGRAQFEVGDMDAAVTTFKRILDDAEEQTTNNLNFLGRAMMESGNPDIAVRVYEELLRRAEDTEQKDHEMLYGEDGKMYERLIFKTATAALEAGLYDKAVKYSDKLLEINEKTAYFFKLKMALAEAKRQQTPPDYQGAVEALTEILRFAQDETMKNRALIELGRTFMMNEALGVMAYRRALAQFGQIALVTDQDVVLLADPDSEADREFVEEALYKSAVCYSILGEEKEKQTVVEKYRELFPTGKYAADINSLPAAKF